MYANHHFLVRVYRHLREHLYMTRVYCPYLPYLSPCQASLYTDRPSRKGIKVRFLCYLTPRADIDIVYTSVNICISYMWAGYEYGSDLRNYEHYLSSNENKAWKKFRLVTVRYRCSARPTELQSQLGAGYYIGSQYIHIFILRYLLMYIDSS